MDTLVLSVIGMPGLAFAIESSSGAHDLDVARMSVGAEELEKEISSV